jgi:hypothetical protein
MIEAHKVADAMKKYGNGFIAKIGDALHHANKHQSHAIKQALPNEWKKYKELSKK